MKLNEKEIIAAQCRESYRHFFIEFWDTIVPEKLIWNWHLDVLCDELQELSERVFAGQFKDHDTIINVCPSSSKSMAASIMLLPWQWTRMAHYRSINASYAYPLALDLSRKSRDVINSDKYAALFPEIKLRKDQDTKGYFANTKGGMRYAVGTRGSVTGMHAHGIIIDDPIDPNQAVSELEMETAGNWIQQTLLSRKIDRRITFTALIMQRLSQGDPTDEMAKRANIKHYIIPASDEYEIKPPEFRSFYQMGLMDPVRLPREILISTEEEMGPYAFAGQYGQSPVPAGGAQFRTEMLGYGVPNVRFKRKVRFWDKAGSRKGDYTAGVKLGITKEGNIWVLDVIRERVNTFQREKLIKDTAARDGYGVVIGQEQDPSVAGLESVHRTVRSLQGYRVRTIPAKKDKSLRADLFSQDVNAGIVTLAYAPWNKVYVEEMKFFPFSKYDDQIDGSSGAHLLVIRKKKRIGGLRHRSDILNNG